MTHDLRSGSATTVLAPNHAIPLSISLSLVFPGGLSFLLNSSSWMSRYISKDTTTLSAVDKKRERKVSPPTDWVYHPPSSPFVLCLLYTIPPIHQAYQPLYPIDFNPIHPHPSAPQAEQGQKAKKASEKSTIPCFYMYISSSCTIHI